MVVFAVGGVTDDGDPAACRIELRTLQTAVEAYRAGTGDLPVSEEDPVSRYVEAPAERSDFTVAAAVTHRRCRVPVAPVQRPSRMDSRRRSTSTK